MPGKSVDDTPAQPRNAGDAAKSYTVSEFVCARCGNCCRGEGIVRATLAECRTIAAFLQMELDEFLARYTREPEDEEDRRCGVRWFVDKPGPDRECVFLENNLCRIHPVKPQRCRTFPLAWRTPDILEYCVGMQRES